MNAVVVTSPSQSRHASAPDRLRVVDAIATGRHGDLPSGLFGIGDEESDWPGKGPMKDSTAHSKRTMEGSSR